MHATRRTFLKTGITAGAGLTLAAPRGSAAVKSVSGEFSILGLKGTVRLQLAEEIPDGAAFQIDVEQISSGVATAHIRLSTGKPLAVEKLTIAVPVPLRDVQKIWYSQQLDGLGQHVYVGIPWSVDIPAAGNCGSLIAGALNRSGRNRGILALKNQSGDGSLTFGNNYAGQFLNMAVNRFVPERPYHTDEIDETVYLSLEDAHWVTVIRRFVEWYDRVWNLSYNTPQACFEPVWNTWYPSMGKLSDEFVDRNARKCVELGFKNLIIDDGWMVGGGDWVAKKEVFPDFRATVDRMHDLGLRVILWYFSMNMDERSTAFREWSRYRVLAGGSPRNVMCVRCPEVRDRMAFHAGELMRMYNLDGLKLDFLDTDVGGPLVNCTGDHPHDFDFVSDGIRDVARRMAEAARAVKPDAILEYRLNYANVANRQWGNCYRGQDTPSDPDLARRHLGLIRSWCRGVAPHSDPAYWPLQETNENVARFLATAVLYAVPQISVNFAEISPNHTELVRTWIAFYNEHRERMFAGNFELLSDDPHYSAARISSGGRTYLPCFLQVWPSSFPVLPDHTGTLILFNGSGVPRITTRLEGVSGSFRLSATDMFHKPSGKPVTVRSEGNTLVLNHPVEVGGLMYLTRN